MKVQCKKLLNLLCIFLLLAISGCEKDIYENAVQEKDKLLIRKVSLKQMSINENPELFKTVNKIRIAQNSQAKMVYDSINKFYFDDENGKEIIAPDGKRSYTFAMYADDEVPAAEKKVENILFAENKENGYDAYSVKYNFTEEQLKTLSQEQLQELSATYTNIATKMVEPMCVFILEWRPYDSIEGELHGFQNLGHWVVTYVSCESSPPASGTSPGGAGSTTNPNNPNNLGGGTGGYTTPVVLEDDEKAWAEYAQFTRSLPEETQDWLSITENSSINAEAFNFLTLNGYSGSNMSCIKNALPRIKENPGLFTTLKPFIIEKQIDGSTLDPCSKKVIDDLKKLAQNDIAYIFSRLDNPATPYITIIKNEQFVGNDFGQTTHPTTNNYNIKIRSNYLNGTDHEPNSRPTSLSIAASILHELIHAHLHSLYDDYNNGTTSAFCYFPLLFDAYVSHTYPGGNPVDAHHEEMAQNFVNTIASALREYDIKNGGSTTTDPQIYSDLAWSTFSGTPIFDQLFPNTGIQSQDVVRDRILNRKFVEARNQPRGSQNPVGTPCN